MQTKMRNTLKLLTVLLLMAATLGSGLYRLSAEAASLPAGTCGDINTNTRTCDLYATSGMVTIPGVGDTMVWGYSFDGTAPGLPGPVLIVNQGDTVTVNLINNLNEPTALLFNGQGMIPDTDGVAPGGTKTYTFTASKPGTFLYQASPLLVSGSAHQVAMGLYGALVVRPATAGQAYNSADTVFDDEALLVLSEIDPNLNNSGTPSDFDLRTYHPTDFLINGKVYSGPVDDIPVTAGNKVLLRFVNAGLQAHSMALLGLNQSVIAVDGSPFSNARQLTADTIFSGQTSDVLVNMPSLDGEHRFAVYDATFPLSNNTSPGFGGMLTFLKMGETVPPPTDTVGPLTTDVALNVAGSPVSKVPGGEVDLTAIVSDLERGDNVILAAEYFIGDPGLNGAGTSMVLGDGSGTPTVSVSATIYASSLDTGIYSIYVHGQDSAGNWGPFSSAVLAVDKSGPVIFSLELVPNPSNGSNVLMHITADDRATGDSVVTSAEYRIDGGDWNLLEPYTTAASTFYFFDALINQSAGATISVRATDELDNVGAVATIGMVVDTTGPVTSLVTATPDTTNGVNQQLNSSIAAVRVTADFNDGPSNISKAEGFLMDCNVELCADGTGFVFVSTDGLFDSQSETGYIDIPLAQFWIMAQQAGPGNFTISVHAQDASGNWGNFSTTTVTVVP